MTEPHHEAMAGGRLGPLPASVHRPPSLAGKGARIVDRAEGIYIWDTDGNKILDAHVGPVVRQRRLRPAASSSTRRRSRWRRCRSTTPSSTPRRRRPSSSPSCWPRSRRRRLPARRSSRARARRATTPSCAWCAATGTCSASRSARSSSAAATATTARRWPAPRCGGMTGMHAQGGLPIPDIVHIEQPLLVRVGRAHLARGLRPAGGARARGEDPRGRRRQGRGLHRRAGAGRGRRHRAAVHLLARDPAHLRPVRHPARSATR